MGKQRMPPEGGASLLEFSLCLALLGVLALPALVSMKELHQRRRMHALASQVYADLQYARSESVRNGGTIHLSFTEVSEGSCYWLHTGKSNACACDGAGKVSCSAAGELLRSHWQPISSATRIHSNVGRMTFQGLQGTVSSAGSIDIRVNNGPGIRHVVSIMGRVRSCSPDTDRGSLPRC